MNYADLPQQQYSNERTYPTYLAHQQTIAETDEPPIALDEQIHSKLVSLHQRSNDLQCYAHRQNNYAYRNRSFAAPSTRQSSLISDREHSLPSDGDDDEEEDEERTSSVGTYAGIPGYYSGPYSTGDDEFDLASVVFWYRNMMQSVKKLL